MKIFPNTVAKIDNKTFEIVNLNNKNIFVVSDDEKQQEQIGDFDYFIDIFNDEDLSKVKTKVIDKEIWWEFPFSVDFLLDLNLQEWFKYLRKWFRNIIVYDLKNNVWNLEDNKSMSNDYFIWDWGILSDYHHTKINKYPQTMERIKNNLKPLYRHQTYIKTGEN